MKEKFYKLYSPSGKLNSASYELLKDLDVQNVLNKANKHYYHWEVLRFKDWIPASIFPNKKDFWHLLKAYRFLSSHLTPIRDENGSFYKINTGHYNEFLHIIDKEMAGNFMGVIDFSEEEKKQYIARSLIEESIASSQLEGANTSREVAKKMLIERRKPYNYSEQMIVNNYNAMKKIEQELYKEKLSWELICELHKMITDKTLPENKQGVLRETFDTEGNRLVIKPWSDGKTAYVTPNKEFVQGELSRLIAFANEKETDNGEFIHPLIKGIMLHFWIGILHPFEDGNGRLARILFYWYMLSKEYWAFAYLSLSEKIKKSPNQYAMAFIYSEQDDCDLTYFIHYNLEKLKMARKEFQSYIEKKIGENKLILSLNQKEYGLNERQLKLLQYFYRKIKSYTTNSTHQHLYSIKRITAAKDLNELVKLGLIIPKRSGKQILYYPTEKIHGLFERK